MHAVSQTESDITLSPLKLSEELLEKARAEQASNALVDAKQHYEEGIEQLKLVQQAQPKFKTIQTLLAEAQMEYQALLGTLNQLAPLSLSAFAAFIQCLREHLDNHHRDKKLPKAFINYAWEDDKTPKGALASAQLKKRLSLLKNHLDRLGIETFLDLNDMTGNMDARMRQNIEQSDYFLVIGTPEFRTRTLPPQAGQALTNVAFELGLILEKAAQSQHSKALLPLWLSGESLSKAFPLEHYPQLGKALILDCREDYYQRMIDLENPLGIIPAMLPFLKSDPVYKQLHHQFLKVAHWSVEQLRTQNQHADQLGLLSSLKSYINEQPVVLRFLADKAREEASLKNQLFALITASKTNPSQAIAAANAATILNAAGIPFSNLDFSFVRIPGANLQSALCDGTNFEGADLSRVNFNSAWLSRASFKNAHLQDVNFGECPAKNHATAIQSSAYSRDGSLLAIGEDSGLITIYNARTLEKLREHSGHSGWVYTLAYSSDGLQLCSGSWDKTLKIWDARGSSLEALRTYSGHSSYVLSLAYSPDGNSLCSGSWDKTLKIWDAQGSTLKALRTYRGHSSSVYTLAYSPDGLQLCSGSLDKTLKVWDARGSTLEALHTYRGHSDYVRTLAYSPDGSSLCSGSLDKTLKVWEARSRTLLLEQRGAIEEKPVLEGSDIGGVSAGLKAVQNRWIVGKTDFRYPFISSEAENTLNLPTQAQIQANAEEFGIPLESLGMAALGDIRLLEGVKTQTQPENRALVGGGVKPGKNNRSSAFESDLKYSTSREAFPTDGCDLPNVTKLLEPERMYEEPLQPPIQQVIQTILNVSPPRDPLFFSGAASLKDALFQPETQENMGNGLKNPEKIEAFLKGKIPEDLVLGRALSHGDCFFDALAQMVNQINHTDVNSAKYLRMECHDFYYKNDSNQALVDRWNTAEFNGIDKKENYGFIQYTHDECEQLFISGRSPIWGRPHIEGRILCRQLDLKGLCIIEILEDPETKQSVLGIQLVNKDTCKSFAQEDAEAFFDDPTIPILVVEQKSLHFVPLLRNEEKLSNRMQHMQAGVSEAIQQTFNIQDMQPIPPISPVFNNTRQRVPTSRSQVGPEEEVVKRARFGS